MKKVLRIGVNVFVVSLVVGILYMSYFYLIGIPKTQARTYYNRATIEMDKGNTDKAKEDLTKALSYWHEDYIAKALDDLK